MLGFSIIAGTCSSGYRGDGGAATDAKLDAPHGVAVDSSGNVYLAMKNNHVIRKVDAATGNISTIAGMGSDGYTGDGGPATSAQLGEPYGVAVDASGDIYIADKKYDVIRKIDRGTGNISTFAGTGTPGYSGDGGPATSAELEEPHDVAVDASGDVYIAGKKNHVIRKVDAGTGDISTFAGTGASGYSGDGGPATLAKLRDPVGVSVDNSGNVYIADKYKDVVRKVNAATGNIETIAGTGSSGYSGDDGPATDAKLDSPHGAAADSLGNVYITDTSNNKVRQVDASTQEISTINSPGSYSGDGGPAILASINEPRGVDVDVSGNFFIAGKKNHVVRRVDEATGIITTYAGDGTSGYSGDGASATAAQLGEPYDVAVDASGIVYIADKGKHVIRKVTVATGIIDTIAGTGSAG